MNTFPRLLGCERGATALEFAFLAPVFFAMIFGVIDVARVAWTLGSLHFAAEGAARYASLNYDSSGNPPAAATVQTYPQRLLWREPRQQPIHLFGDGLRQHCHGGVYLYPDDSLRRHLVDPAVGDRLLPLI